MGSVSNGTNFMIEAIVGLFIVGALWGVFLLAIETWNLSGGGALLLAAVPTIFSILYIVGLVKVGAKKLGV